MSEISELYARDPNKLTDQDIDAIVARYRQDRATFNLSAPRKVSTAPKKPPIPGLNIDLSSLGLK